MGLFGDVGKFFSNPVRAVTAISTFGSSEVFKKAVPKKYQAPIIQGAGLVASAITANPLPAAAAAAYLKADASFTPRPSYLPTGTAVYRPNQGVKPMSLDLGSILGTVGGIFGGNQNPYFQGISNVATLAQQFVPQRASAPTQLTAYPVAQRTNVPMRLGNTPIMSLTNDVISAGGKLLATLGIPVRSSSAFPSILKRSLSALASLARRTPAGTIVSLLAGVGLTAYESNLLVAWHSQRKKSRRMNVCNAKALRRAGRRIKGFHKLCQHLDIKKTVHRRSK